MVDLIEIVVGLIGVVIIVAIFWLFLWIAKRRLEEKVHRREYLKEKARLEARKE